MVSMAMAFAGLAVPDDQFPLSPADGIMESMHFSPV